MTPVNAYELQFGDTKPHYLKESSGPQQEGTGYTVASIHGTDFLSPSAKGATANYSGNHSVRKDGQCKYFKDC